MPTARLGAEAVAAVVLRLEAGDLGAERLGLGAAVGLLLGGQQQARAAAHAVQDAGGTGEGARQRVGQTDRLVEPRQELIGRRGELPEGAADREGRALELAIQPFDGAQQRRKHGVGGEFALRAELAELADGDAELARQRLRQRRQAFEDGAQFVALQRARRQRLGELLRAGGDLLLAGTRGDGDALKAADQGGDLVGGGADLTRGDREAGEGVHALADRDAGLEAVAIEPVVDLPGALDRTEGRVQPAHGLGERVAGHHHRAQPGGKAGDLHAAHGDVEQVQRARGAIGTALDALQAALAGLADLAQLLLDAGSVVQRQPDRDAACAIRHASRLLRRWGGQGPGESGRRAALPAARPMRMASSSSAAAQPEAPISRTVASAAGMSRSRPAIVAVAQVVPAAQQAAPSTLAGAWAA